MSDQFRVSRAHIEAHVKLLEEQKKFFIKDDTEKNTKTYKVPRAHIEAHARLLEEQKRFRTNKENNIYKVPKAHIEMHAELLQEQKKLQNQINFLQRLQQNNENLTREFQYPQVD